MGDNIIEFDFSDEENIFDCDDFDVPETFPKDTEHFIETIPRHTPSDHEIHFSDWDNNDDENSCHPKRKNNKEKNPLKRIDKLIGPSKSPTEPQMATPKAVEDLKKKREEKKLLNSENSWIRRKRSVSASFDEDHNNSSENKNCKRKVVISEPHKKNVFERISDLKRREFDSKQYSRSRSPPKG